MYKYINIKSVLSVIPYTMLEEENEATIIKWALRGYTTNITNRYINSDIKFAVCEVKNHKADVPQGLKKIQEAGFSTTLPGELGDGNNLYLQPTFDGQRIIIFQALLFQMIRPSMQVMRYTGQNSDIVENGCKPILCQDCLNFSISKDLSTLTCDVKDGYVFLLYTSAVTDDSGDFLIPNSPILLSALAAYCEAQDFKGRSFRREQGSEETYQLRMREANLLFEEFMSKEMLSNLDVTSV